MAGVGKPTVEDLQRDLQIDIETQDWLRSGDGDGSLDVALVGGADERWVLVRVAGDPSGRVLIYSPHEWACFLDGARRGEFEDAVD